MLTRRRTLGLVAGTAALTLGALPAQAQTFTKQVTIIVANAAGDGHTLLITDVGTLATQPNLVKKLSFDVQNDLVPIGMVMFSPYLFAVHPEVPAATLEELIAYDKANPG